MDATCNDEAATTIVLYDDEPPALTAFNNGRIDVVITRGVMPPNNVYLSLTSDSSSDPARISMPNAASCLSVSSAQRVAFVALFDRTLRVYDLSNATLALTPHIFVLERCITSMIVTRDNKVLIAGDIEGINTSPVL